MSVKNIPLSEIIPFLECIGNKDFDKLRDAVQCFMVHHEPFELEEVFLTRIEPALDRDSLHWLLTEKFMRLNSTLEKSGVARNSTNTCTPTN